MRTRNVCTFIVLVGCGEPATSESTDAEVHDTGPTPDTYAADTSNDTLDSASLLVPPCPVAAPCVLFYGPIVYDSQPTPLDSKVYAPFEKPLLPPASVVTIADDAAWKAMTTADFGKYNLIVIGDTLDWHPHAEYLQTAFDTRAVWNPAISGRAVVQGIDVGFHTTHSNNVDAAKTYLSATLAWLTSGPGTALYVSSIARDYDYLEGLGKLASVSDPGDVVTIDLASHPIFAGSTSASLSNWVTSYHRTVASFPSDFHGVAHAASGNSVVVVRDR